MITPIHLLADLAVFSVIYKFSPINVNTSDLILLFSSELIDLDHLFSKPIYHPRRNPFKKHSLHRSWKIILPFSIIILFIRPLIFLGVGIISHFFLDYMYIIIYKLKK